MYAQNTTVPFEKSLEEIRRTLIKVGTENFIIESKVDQVVIAFDYKSTSVRMIFNMPSHPGNEGTIAQVKKYEQARKTRWRQILLYLKAKFEFILCGIETFEQAFMGHIIENSVTTKTKLRAA